MHGFQLSADLNRRKGTKAFYTQIDTNIHIDIFFTFNLHITWQKRDDEDTIL